MIPATTMMRFSAFIVALLFWFPSGTFAAFNNATQPVIIVPMAGNGVPNGFATYAIPPFSVKFTTLNTLSGDPNQDITMLRSEFGPSLKAIVGYFVKDGFLAQETAEYNSPTPNLKLDFVAVDFLVTIQHSFAENPERRRIRQEAQLQAVDSSLIQQAGYVQFYAKFVGMAFFVAPNGVSLPREDDMHNILFNWLNRTMEDQSDLIKDFQSSRVPMLNNLQSLSIDTNIDTGSTTPEQNHGSNNRARRGAFIALIVLSLVAVIVACFCTLRYARHFDLPFYPDHSIDPTATHIIAAQPRRFSPKNVEHHDHTRSCLSPNLASTIPHSNNPLPGRRPGDADERILLRQQSERWVKENRPDLYEAAQKSSSKLALAENEDACNAQSRRLSLPLQFLFGKLFKRDEEPDDNDATKFWEDVDLETEASNDNNHAVTSNNEGDSWWNMVLQGLTGTNSKLACDEDPASYNFPFADFPRHDGTPCLIYKETPEGGVRVVRSTTTFSDPNRPRSLSGPLSNEEFKRVLSLNSEPSESGAHDEDYEVDDDMNIDGEVVRSQLGKSLASSNSLQFTDKLERLVAMRLRHFERQTILDKHKKKTEQQQKQRSNLQEEEEARQRELKLRRHEMELDMKDIEAELTPRAITALRSSNTSGSSASLSGTFIGRESGSQAVRSVSNSPNRVLGTTTTMMGSVGNHRVTSSDSDFIKKTSSLPEFSLDDDEDDDDDDDNNNDSDDDSDEGDENHSNNKTTLKSSTPPRAPSKTSSPSKRANPNPSSTEQAPSNSVTIAASKAPARGPNLASPFKNKLSRCRSHRRWNSQGTGPNRNNVKKTSTRDNSGSALREPTGELPEDEEQDVMTFGIAAYTNFV